MVKPTYFGLLALVALQRVLELRRSRRHQVLLLRRGGQEVGAEHYPWMVTLHTLFFLACGLETEYRSGVWVWPWSAFFGILLGLATGLRWWSIRTLGERWTTRVMILPGAERISRGPYRYLNHPNYLAVVIEFFSIPMILMNWWTATVFSLLNLWLLSARIRIENQALAGAERSST